MSFKEKLSAYLPSYIFWLLLITVMPSAASAQNRVDSVDITDSAKAFPSVLNPLIINHTEKSNESLYTPPKKRFGRAMLLLGAAEMAPWIYDRYIVQVDWAKITWQTTGHNIKPSSWEFDNDPFTTNQFGHPFHGSLFFNSFRSNGYNFYQSAAAAAAGSYLWETFAETQPPSYNDFVNTTFGGIVLGEMTHRLSNKIINNKSTGFKRQISEIAGFILNPMNGLNRIIDGKWGKYNNAQPGSKPDSSKIYTEFDIGGRVFGTEHKNVLKRGTFGWFARAKFLYGNQFEDIKTPFSNMYIVAELGRDDSTTLNAIRVYGSITGWELSAKKNRTHVAVLSANYDYLRNESFFYGGQSIRLNLYSGYNVTKKLRFTSIFGLGPVLLAAVPSKYVFNNRNYSYGSGVGVIAGGSVSVFNKLSYSINYNGAWVKTINGYNSYYFLHMLTNEFKYSFSKKFEFSAEPGYMNLYGKYKYLPDEQSHYPYLRLSVRYTVML